MNYNIYIVHLCLLYCCLLVNSQYINECITSPNTTDCESYTFPDSVSQACITNMCSGSMKNMPSCHVESICQEEQYRTNSGVYCQPFGIYKEICTDMSMGNCSYYSSMCQPGTMVQQCDMEVLPLPSTSQTVQLVKEICGNMSMSGCEECGYGTQQKTTKQRLRAMPSCDIFETYTSLCLAMPQMSQCQAWQDICDKVPNWPICPGSSGNNIPAMQMFFHVGIKDYILFQNWVPVTNGQYAGAWIAIFISAILYEVLKLVRSRAEKRWKIEAERIEMASLIDETSILPRGTPFRAGVDISRAFLHLFEVFWGFLLMLVVMTYNTGLFFAVLAGAFLGMLLVGRFLDYTPKAACH